MNKSVLGHGRGELVVRLLSARMEVAIMEASPTNGATSTSEPTPFPAAPAHVHHILVLIPTRV